MKRKLLQDEAIKDITEVYYGKQNIFMSEISTGSGKSKIILESAKKIMEKENRSVFISTLNNSLVKALLEENKKHDIVEDDKISLLIGSGNYIDKNEVLNDTFLNELDLSKNEVASWLEANEFVDDFINHFDISESFKSSINSSTESNEELKLSNRIESICNCSPKIYITSHAFFITLFRYLKTEHKRDYNNETVNDMLETPLIFDEVHALNEVATLIFSEKFSSSISKSYINGILNDEAVSKANKKVFLQVKHALISFIKLFDLYTEDKIDIYRNKLNQMKESFNDLNLSEAIRKSLKNSKIDSKTRKKLILLQKEFSSLIYICREQNLYSSEISLSPTLKYPVFKVQSKNPTSGLRNIFAESKAYICGVSGTLKVSTDTSLIANLWSLERLGFFGYKNNEDYENFETCEEWNNRLSLSIYFKCYERFFKKEQSHYYIFANDRYTPPKMDKKENKKAYELLELNWIDAIKDATIASLKGNALVLMSSFRNCKLLADSLSSNEQIMEEFTILYSNPNQSMTRLKKDYFEAIQRDEKVILIGNLQLWTGIDLVDKKIGKNSISNLIIGKLPFEPTNIYSKYRYGSFSEHVNMKKKAILSFRQGLGRGIRTENDKLFITICDNRIIKSKYKDFLFLLDEFALKYE